MRLFICIVAFGATVSHAAAQPPSEPVTVPKWDLAGSVGWFSAHVDPSDIDRYSDDWLNTWHVGLTVGRYLTPHVKTELEWAAMGEDERYRTRAVFLPAQPTIPFHYNFEELIKSQQVSATLVWQFYENRWAHPFVVFGGGAQFVRARARVFPTTFFVGSPATRMDFVPPAEPNRSYTAAQAIVGVGGKLYFTTHAFARPEMRLGFEHNMTHVTFRIGVGVDF